MLSSNSSIMKKTSLVSNEPQPKSNQIQLTVFDKSHYAQNISILGKYLKHECMHIKNHNDFQTWTFETGYRTRYTCTCNSDVLLHNIACLQDNEVHCCTSKRKQHLMQYINSDRVKHVLNDDPQHRVGYTRL